MTVRILIESRVCSPKILCNYLSFLAKNLSSEARQDRTLFCSHFFYIDISHKFVVLAMWSDRHLANRRGGEVMLSFIIIEVFRIPLCISYVTGANL